MPQNSRAFINRVTVIREKAMATIAAVRRGEVSEDELDKLQNFVLFSLALIPMMGENAWKRAKKHAELLSYLGEDLDAQGVHQLDAAPV
jgi:hypothetical protein